MKFIDPHIHLFDVALGDYGWLKEENQPNWPDKPIINRSFDQDDLVVDSTLSLAGFVHIEAGFDNERPWREIAWLEQHVSLAFSAIAGVDVTLDPAKFKLMINKLTQYKSVVGIRHIFDEDAVEILSHRNTSSNLQYLQMQGMIFETQIIGDDDAAVEHYCEMAWKNPHLQLILGHANFCGVDAQAFSPWLINIEKVAKNTNVMIKASGWEMMERAYSFTHVVKVVNVLIEVFSPGRVMLASNFPLTLFSQSYADLWSKYASLSLPSDILGQVTFDNAKRIYKL